MSKKKSKNNKTNNSQKNNNDKTTKTTSVNIEGSESSTDANNSTSDTSIQTSTNKNLESSTPKKLSITEEFLKYSQFKNSGNNKKAKAIRKEILMLDDIKARIKYERIETMKSFFSKGCKNIFLVCFSIATILACTGTLIVGSIIKDTPPIDPSRMQELFTENSMILDANGDVTEQIHGEHSRFLINDITEVPKDLINSFLAIEDANFYEHKGISLKRIAGAVIANIKAQGKAQGASTITQQLAKNLYLTNEKTYTRKISEIYYSFILEQKLSKDEILTAYLNTAYLGQGAKGVAAAAHIYFNKPLEELNLAECALIAGITKYPSKFAAFKSLPITTDEDWDNLQILPIAQDYVPTEDDYKIYDILLEKDKIDKLTYDALKKGRKRLYKAVFNPDSKDRQEVVLRRMFELGFITEEERSAAKNYEIKIQLGSNKNEAMSTYFNTLVKQDVVKALVKNGYTNDEAEKMLYTGGLRIYSTLDPKLQNIVEKEYENNSNFPGTFTDKNGNLQPQSATVILDNATGQIKAMIGGRGIGGESIYNRAIKPRQPGSAIKPLAVYLHAIEHKGLSPASIVKDEPITRQGKAWPRNANGKYRGTMTLSEAIKWSSNAATVRTASTFGKNERESMKVVVDALEKIGISTVVRREENPSHHDELYPTVLGGMSHGVSPLEMTAAFATIANNGIYTEPTTFSKIELADGTLLLHNEPNRTRVYSESTAYYMTQMLEGVVNGGTGSRAKLSKMPSAGKTGTTSNQYDAWFCGFTPYYTSSTWIGVDIPRKMVNGSGMAASLWKKVMTQAHEGLKKKDFLKPTDLKSINLCSESGLLASDLCTKYKYSNKISVTKDRIPKKYCTIEHTRKEVDTEVAPPTSNGNTNDDNNDNNNSSSGSSGGNSNGSSGGSSSGDSNVDLGGGSSGGSNGSSGGSSSGDSNVDLGGGSSGGSGGSSGGSSSGGSGGSSGGSSSGGSDGSSGGSSSGDSGGSSSGGSNGSSGGSSDTTPPDNSVTN